MTDEQAIKLLTGDSGAFLRPEDGFAFLVEPEVEKLTVLRLAVCNGRRIYKCHRVVTGNEYRVWQQTGNVPLHAVDAGSSPAGGACFLP